MNFNFLKLCSCNLQNAAATIANLFVILYNIEKSKVSTKHRLGGCPITYFRFNIFFLIGSHSNVINW